MSVEITPNGTRGGRFPGGPLVKAMLGLNAALYRLVGGRGMSGMLLLTTVGARTGRERTAPVAWFPDGEDAWLVVASAGGAATHPAWYRNLAANPDQVWIQVGSRRLKVRARSLSGDERDERWRRIVAKAPNFGNYERKTDRQIPVVRLTPAD